MSGDHNMNQKRMRTHKDKLQALLSYLSINVSILNEAIDEEPDTTIVLLFWYDKGQFKIKTSSTPDRLALIGMLEEAKAKVISDGYAS